MDSPQPKPIPIGQLTSSQNPSPFKHDINECILAIVAADGEQKLAAERLGISAEELRITISVDPNAKVLIAAHLKTLQMLRMFQLITRTGEVVESKLHDLTAFEATRTHLGYVKLFSELAGEQGEVNAGNLPDAVLKLLPPTVREAVLGLMAKPPSDRQTG